MLTAASNSLTMAARLNRKGVPCGAAGAITGAAVAGAAVLDNAPMGAIKEEPLPQTLALAIAPASATALSALAQMPALCSEGILDALPGPGAAAAEGDCNGGKGDCNGGRANGCNGGRATPYADCAWRLGLEVAVAVPGRGMAVVALVVAATVVLAVAVAVAVAVASGVLALRRS